MTLQKLTSERLLRVTGRLHAAVSPHSSNLETGSQPVMRIRILKAALKQTWAGGEVSLSGINGIPQ
jgi:hypothetical protein